MLLSVSRFIPACTNCSFHHPGHVRSCQAQITEITDFSLYYKIKVYLSYGFFVWVHTHPACISSLLWRKSASLFPGSHGFEGMIGKLGVIWTMVDLQIDSETAGSRILVHGVVDFLLYFAFQKKKHHNRSGNSRFVPLSVESILWKCQAGALVCPLLMKLSRNGDFEISQKRDTLSCWSHIRSYFKGATICIYAKLKIAAEGTLIEVYKKTNKCLFF